jgi:uncharacterized membrane protein
MHARARLLGHPIHQMLIVFPVWLFATSVVFDIVRLATGNLYWSDVAFWMIASGLIGGALAAIFGLVDYISVPRYTRARRIGATHGIGNVFVMALFLGSWVLRNNGDTSITPIVLSFAGFALAGFTAWLGGELVDRLGVGVDEGAHVDAPSSLSKRAAGEHATPPELYARP